MLKFVALCLFVLFFSCSNAQQLTEVNLGVFGSSGPSNLVTALPPVGSSSYSFTIETNSTNGAVNLCIQRGIPPPGQVAWGGCTLYLTFNPGSMAPAPFNPVPIYAGANYYFIASTNSSDPIGVVIRWTINACPVTEIGDFAAKTCQPATALQLKNNNAISFNAGISNFYFTLAIPQTPSSAYLSLLTLTSVATSSTVNILAGYGLNNVTDSTATWTTVITNTLTEVEEESDPSTIILPASLPGTWYYVFTVQATSAGTFNFSLNLPTNCDASTPQGCPKVNTFTGRNTNFALSKQMGYYLPPNPTGSTWRIGVSAQAGQALNKFVQVYIANGYLPYTTPSGAVVADWSGGCTLPSDECTWVQTIELPKSVTNQTYFIAAVYNNPGSASDKFFIYESTSQTPCPDCNRGSCPVPGPGSKPADYGKCSCPHGYTGVNCDVSNSNFMLQIIVVIIIGCLLLLTAVIGLVAWCITKRRQTGGYENI